VKLLWTGWSAFFVVVFVMIVGVLVELVFCFVVLLMFVFLFEFEFGVNGVVGCFFLILFHGLYCCLFIAEVCFSVVVLLIGSLMFYFGFCFFVFLFVLRAVSYLKDVFFLI